ncbi:MAG: hypothetical protein RIR26_2573 [Pseudomonadota bacterium]
MKYSKGLICVCSHILFTLGCVTLEREDAPSDQWLNRVMLSMSNTCRLKPKNGFSADLLVQKFGGVKIEGVWDFGGHLNGQILNPIGEDVLNFKLDSSGLLQTDASSQLDASTLNALSFLGQLGAQRTRLLLCSGMFLDKLPEASGTANLAAAEKSYEIQLPDKNVSLKSKLKPRVNNEQSFTVNSVVKTDSFFISRTLARIEWEGNFQENTIEPRALRITTPQTEISLSFLDFE